MDSINSKPKAWLQNEIRQLKFTLTPEWAMDSGYDDGKIARIRAENVRKLIEIAKQLERLAERKERTEGL